jgi:hypothetical protein
MELQTSRNGSARLTQCRSHAARASHDTTEREGHARAGPGAVRCSGPLGSPVRFEFSKARHAQFVSLAPPRAVPKPQRMRMARTLRPHRVDEVIMHVLLRIVDDALNITRDVIDQLPKTDRVVQGQQVVTSSNGRVQIMKK